MTTIALSARNVIRGTPIPNRRSSRFDVTKEHLVSSPVDVIRPPYTPYLSLHQQPLLSQLFSFATFLSLAALLLYFFYRHRIGCSCTGTGSGRGNILGHFSVVVSLLVCDSLFQALFREDMKIGWTRNVNHSLYLYDDEHWQTVH